MDHKLMDRRAFQKATGMSITDLSEGAKLPADRWNEFIVKTHEQASMTGYISVAGINERGKMFFPAIEIPDQIIRNKQGLKNTADYNMTFLNFTDHDVQTYDVETIIHIDNNLARGNFKTEQGMTQIMGALAAAFARNLEQIGLFSNSLGPIVAESNINKDGDASKFLKLGAQSNYDGWLEMMESGTVIDAENSDDLHGVLGQALLQWPTRYDQYDDDLRFFVPTRLKRIAQINLGTQATNLGDLARNGKIEVTPHGVPMLGISTLPLRPWEVEHKTLTGTTPVTLQYKPVLASELKVLPSSLGETTAVSPYIKDTDYEFTEATSSLVRTASGSSITSGDVVKVGYQTGTKAFLTFPGNLVAGISREMTIQSVDHPLSDGVIYIIRAKVGHTMLLKEANVLIKNIKGVPQAN